VVWRDFAHHLIYHTPHIVERNWREEWDAFPWNTDERAGEVRDWKRGRTGMPVVDAAMREMYVTGRMHNRARMLVASYLTKHLMTHWKIGHGLVRGLPCRLGPGLERDGLAVVGGLRA
jgi:deoxyribodipyrimidine photo-lyase